ncbi:phosphate acetyltransferase [Halogeometricum sp. CBA1124]|nr:phosphate acetyltransferase [Halogeometricum sp. CBA1124]
MAVVRVAGYRLLQRLGDAEADGPMPVGVDDPPTSSGR